jgi:pSer/pThr/pTyr-binding forkhead associated (FHA) protein
VEVKLVLLGGKNNGREIPVPGPKFVIGRAEDCQMRPRSDMISRRHCAIIVEQGSVVLQDFNSKNGTFVNDQRVDSQRELRNGDRIKVGPLELEVQLAVSVGGKRKPKVHSIQEAAARTVQSAGDKELDITRWLADGDEEEEEPAASAAGQTGAAPTESLSSDDSVVTAPEGQSPSKHDVPDDMPDPILGTRAAKKPTAANSRAAAADMIRQIIRRNR